MFYSSYIKLIKYTNNSESNSTISSALVLDGIYYIKNIASNLYLDVTNGSATDGTNIQQLKYWGGSGQH